MSAEEKEVATAWKKGAVKAARGIFVIEHCNKRVGKNNTLAAFIHDDEKKKEKEKSVCGSVGWSVAMLVCATM